MVWALSARRKGDLVEQEGRLFRGVGWDLKGWVQCRYVVEIGGIQVRHKRSTEVIMFSMYSRNKVEDSAIIENWGW